MNYCFKAEVDGLMLTLTAERIYRSKQSERYRLTIAGTGYSLVIQNNRPAAETKKDGKPVQWHVAEGSIDDKSKLDNVYKQLEKALNSQSRPFQGTLNFINRL